MGELKIMRRAAPVDLNALVGAITKPSRTRASVVGMRSCDHAIWMASGVATNVMLATVNDVGATCCVSIV
jgi:hypothetical protein